MAKTYRSARGKSVDLDRILNSNETTRAVGNMNVNARGDTIDSQNKTVQSRNDRVKNAYRKQHKNAVVDDVVPTSKRHAQKIANMEAQLEEAKTEATRIAEAYSQEKMKVEEPKISKPAEEPAPSEVSAPEPTVNPMTERLGEKAKVAPQPVAQPEPEPQPTVAEPAPTESAPKGKGGLAAAIAKARESKQEMLKTDRQQARESEGVKRF